MRLGYRHHIAGLEVVKRDELGLKLVGRGGVDDVDFVLLAPFGFDGDDVGGVGSPVGVGVVGIIRCAIMGEDRLVAVRDVLDNEVAVFEGERPFAIGGIGGAPIDQADRKSVV